MTRLVAISQRVMVDPAHGERRDALDQRWAVFLAACGLAPVPIPNHPQGVEALLAQVPVAGVVLSGGGDIGALGGDDPERDETERRVVQWATTHGLPVVGICRGAQHLTYLFGGRLAPVAGHVAVRHAILPEGREVNSFHAWGIAMPPAGAEVLAQAADGSIEAYRLPAAKVTALLWHPEREVVPVAADLALFTQALDLSS